MRGAKTIQLLLCSPVTVTRERTSSGVISLAGDGGIAHAPSRVGCESAAAFAPRQCPVSASGRQDGAAAAGRARQREPLRPVPALNSGSAVSAVRSSCVRTVRSSSAGASTTAWSSELSSARMAEGGPSTTNERAGSLSSSDTYAAPILPSLFTAPSVVTTTPGWFIAGSAGPSNASLKEGHEAWDCSVSRQRQCGEGGS